MIFYVLWNNIGLRTLLYFRLLSPFVYNSGLVINRPYFNFGNLINSSYNFLVSLQGLKLKCSKFSRLKIGV